MNQETFMFVNALLLLLVALLQFLLRSRPQNEAVKELEKRLEETERRLEELLTFVQTGK